MKRRAIWTVLVVALMSLIAGCGSVPGYNPSGAASGPTSRASGIVVASGHGWTSAGLSGSIPAPGSCHIRKGANGEPLPDPTCTPGAIDKAVTDVNITSTVCRKGGYTSSVRPPEDLTETVKRKLLAAYGIPASDISKYELDHLVDLAAGGASDVRNLWPEPNTFRQFHASNFVHNDKDEIESYTFHAICQHKVSVTAVQNAMATNWTIAVATLGLPPVPANYTG